MSLYSGPLVYKKMAREAYRGFKTWQGMRRRSREFGMPLPNMTSREFIGWWLKEMRSFSGQVPSVGRIDHSRPYFWGNFRIEELAENKLEGIGRAQKSAAWARSKVCTLIEKQTGEPFVTFFFQKDAAAFLGVKKQRITEVFNGTVKNNYKYQIERA